MKVNYCHRFEKVIINEENERILCGRKAVEFLSFFFRFFFLMCFCNIMNFPLSSGKHSAGTLCNLLPPVISTKSIKMTKRLYNDIVRNESAYF